MPNINIRTDKFISTGKTHFICQDYVLEKNNYIVLSDGCSGAEDTDIGARLLCISASKYLEDYKFREIDFNQMGLKIIYNAEMMAKILGLSPLCLSATLIIGRYDPNTYMLQVYVYGDGYVISVDNNQDVIIREITFSQNHPFYLSYYISPENLELYARQGYRAIITDKKRNAEDSQIFRYFDKPIQFSFNMSHFKTVLLASDGISSFNKNTNIWDVVDESVFYKNTTGALLQRRMLRFLSEYEKIKNYHSDDISMGVFFKED